MVKGTGPDNRIVDRLSYALRQECNSHPKALALLLSVLDVGCLELLTEIQ